MDEGYDAWEGIDGYGGEAQFNLGGEGVVSPHLLTGVGRMDFAPDFEGGGEDVPVDRTALILGGGLDLGLGSRVRLSAAVRDYVTSGRGSQDAVPDLRDVRDPQHLAHNWQMSAGLKILVGGDRGADQDRPRATNPQRAAIQPEPGRGNVIPVEDVPREVPRDAPVAPPTDIVPAEPARPVPPESRPAAAPTIVVIPIGLPPMSDVPAVARDSLEAPVAGVMTPDELRDFLQAEVARVIAENRPEDAPPGAGVDQAELEALEARLTELVESRLDEMQRSVEEIARDEAERAAPPVSAPATEVTDPEAVEEEPSSGQSRLDPSLGFPDRELRPYTAVQLAGHTQWVFGVAWDRGPVDTFDAFDIVPEVAFGFGQAAPTWMAATNFQYRLPWVVARETFWVSPVVSLGVGLLNQDGTELVLNASYGAHIQIARARTRDGDPVSIYIAHQGIDLFDGDRLILGLSLER